MTDNRLLSNRERGKLSLARAREIRALYAGGGWTYVQLGTRFGVSDSQIMRVIRDEVWREEASVSSEFVQKRREEKSAHVRRKLNENPDYLRRRHFRQRYGITLEELEKLHLDQAGCCAACGDAIALGIGSRDGGTHVDHCHKSNEVRGLLCQRCNQALGLLRDDPARIVGLLRYLVG